MFMWKTSRDQPNDEIGKAWPWFIFCSKCGAELYPADWIYSRSPFRVCTRCKELHYHASYETANGGVVHDSYTFYPDSTAEVPFIGEYINTNGLVFNLVDYSKTLEEYNLTYCMTNADDKFLLGRDAIIKTPEDIIFDGWEMS